MDLLENMVNANPGRNIVVLCQSNAIKALLSTKILKKLINIKEIKIENSSIFEINVESNPIIFLKCLKIYPIPSNYSPLIQKNNKYYYDLGGKHTPLFDILKNGIPENLVKKENKQVDKSNNNIITNITSKSISKNNSNKNNFSFKKMLDNFNKSKIIF